MLIVFISFFKNNSPQLLTPSQQSIYNNHLPMSYNLLLYFQGV